MLNQVVLVGRLGRIEKIDNNKTKIFVSVQRNYKNINGEYDIDIIPLILKGDMASNTLEYCKVGDMIGVKGRIETKEDKLQVIAEKVTFLSNKSIENKE